MDAANFCRGQDHDVGPLRLHEVPDGELVGQIQFRVGAGDDICLASGPGAAGLLRCPPCRGALRCNT